MKNLHLFLLFCLVLSFHFSCTSKLHIEISMPAAVAIEPEQKKVMVINRLEPKFAPTHNANTAISKAAAHEAFLGAVEAVKADNSLLLVKKDWLNYTAEAYQGIDIKFSKEEFGEIFRKHPHHLLLALDDFTLTINQESPPSATISSFRLTANAHWTLYDSTGTVIDEASIQKHEYIKSKTGLNQQTAVTNAIRKGAPKLNKLAWHTGNEYWLRLQPHTYTYTRAWYSLKKAKEAEAFVAAQEWEKAISVLQPLAESDEKYAGKAAYNLAVVYEASGYIEDAKFWAGKALNKNNSKKRGYLIYEVKHTAREMVHRNNSLAMQLLLELENY